MNDSPWGKAPTPPEPGAYRQMSPYGRPVPPGNEPIFKAPLVAVLLVVSMPVLFWFQLRLPDMGLRWAFYPADLGRDLGLPGVFTAMLLHGGWAHAWLNALTALCFAPPVARMLPGPRGAAVFLAFYALCGIIASLGYGLMHLSSVDPMVGASGAVSGLLGAAIRLMGRPAWAGPRPMNDQRVLGMLAMLMGLNVVIGLIGYAPGAEGARIAWEAHAFGLAAGYLLVGPLFRLSRRMATPVG